MEEGLKLHETMRAGWFTEVLLVMLLGVWVSTYNLTFAETQREM